MNCTDALAELLSGEVTPETAEHIAGCEHCATSSQELSITREVLGDKATWAEPSPELRDKVLRDLNPMDDAPLMRQSSMARIAAVAVSIAAAVAIFALARPASDWEIDMYAVDDTAVATLAGWNEEAGTRLLFDGDLERPDEGYVYELWFSDENRLLSAGTFVSGNDVALSVAVRRGQLPNLWVTLEPIDGDPTPSGEVILTSSK